MSREFGLLFCVLLLHCLLEANAQNIVRTISTGSDTVTVDFELFPIRSPNFLVLVQNDDGNFIPQTPRTPQTYLGTVRGHPGAMASGLLKASGTLLCRISFENGIEWSSTGGVATVRGSTDWKAQWPTTLVPPTTGDSVLFVAEVGVDASYAEYVATGSNVYDTIDMVEFSVMAANVPYLRDASILHKIGKVVIRASQSRDPYAATADTGVLLNTVKSQWNDVIASVVGKTQHICLVVHPGAGGGLAYVATVATPNAYSSNGADPNGDFSIIWRHEAGHNWGSFHYEGGGQPEGPTIMSDNALSRFSSSELATILHYKTRVTQLATNMVVRRPPRANMDIATIPSKSPFYLDVLDNDLDANIKGLKLTSVQNPSAMGSTLQVVGNKVFYIPSTAAELSVDSFSYTIQNVYDRDATGYVIVRPDALVAWWKMEETSGLTVQDSSGNAAAGDITGSTTWDQYGSGLVFGGAGKVSLGTKPSLHGTTSFSVSVWVRVPPSATSTSAVIVQQRSPPTSTTNGYNGEYVLSLANGKPQFMVFGDGDWQFEFSAPAAINNNQWHHIVAMRDQTEGRIYIDGKLSASASGQLKNLDGEIPVFMGWDARDSGSFFTGSLMGARIYNRALNSDEISYLSTRPESLVGWWKLDDKSGLSAEDSSGNFATGTISGSTTWEQDGGLVFRGSGKVSFSTRPSLRGKTSFSIHAWVKVPASANSEGIIIQQRSPPSSTTDGFNGEYVLSLANGKPKFMLFGDGDWQFEFSAPATINDNQWHHIVAMRDQTEGHIYIDGELSATASGQVKNLDGEIPVFMGWDARDSGSFFTGSLRGVKVYNQAVIPHLQDQSNTILLAQA